MTHASASARPPGQKVILVVDDEALLREILRDVFSYDDDVTVLEAENGRVALDIITSRVVDLVITDSRMPDGDGPTLIRAVNALPDGPGKPKLFMCTGHSDTPESELRALGVLELFSKPCDIVALRNAALAHL